MCAWCVHVNVRVCVEVWLFGFTWFELFVFLVVAFHLWCLNLGAELAFSTAYHTLFYIESLYFSAISLLLLLLSIKDHFIIKSSKPDRQHVSKSSVPGWPACGLSLSNSLDILVSLV